MLKTYKLNLGGGDWCPKCERYGFVDDCCVLCGYTTPVRPGL